MGLRCPTCREPIDSRGQACPNGHSFEYRDGVLRLLDAAFADRLESFTARLSAIREAEGKRLTDVSAYEGLPYSQLESGDPAWRTEWRLRCHDLDILFRLVAGRSRRRVLDVGAWNGWLSHRLAAQGHDVTAVDYFDDACDGLAARKHYRAHWRAIQMDLEDLAVLDEPFDVIVLNRCLAFFPDPVAGVISARRLLAEDGTLVITGLQFFRDAAPRARFIASQREAYRARYDFELFLKPTKGYFDWEDRRRLGEAGVVLKSYPQLWLANLRALARRALPWHMYGLAFAEPSA
ncbi:MAG TPA: class I SAM-dependent methyltransferase [Anaerolineae bacterium]|nr:class I SAM-dependent methyltransferase [Anaerolineae bacterium]